MVRRTLILILSVLSLMGPATAQELPLPALHDVTGVTPDDVLNVRAEPAASAEILGTLPPDARDIEVVRSNEAGTWGQINLGERAAWVSLRYLERQPGQARGTLPAVSQCYGVEPFWSLDLSDTPLFRSPEAERPLLSPPTFRAASGRMWPWALFAQTDAGPLRGILSRQICSDGMSDRTFGLQLDLIVEDGSLYTGCCTLR